LRKGEISIRFATSGAAALDLLDANGTSEPILLLSDINMPGMNGLELLAETKRRWPTLRVIMITAYGDADNRRRALEAGASDFVTKPVDFALLKQTLGSLMGGDGI
jgi:CheY-like chemotaxis protein